MAEIAIICNVHETTVSRTVSGKYLRCQFGLFPMRYFFSHGCPINGGTAVSSTFVKEIIRLLIKKENPKKPLSDGSITTLLEKRDINIKRRTVAKYREELGVLAAHLRRQY